LKNESAGFSKLERFELKYTIPFDMIEPISRFCEPYCVYDKHSEKSSDGFYEINNLYFDSPGFYLLRQRMSDAERRFNLRVRSYGHNAKLPYHLEVKEKTGNIVRKFRSTVHSKDWWKIFYQPGFIPDSSMDDKSLANLRLFERLATALSAEQKILTSYRRKALVSTVDQYARVTFDTELRYQEPDYKFVVSPDYKMMHSYDFETIFDPFASVVLELKCNAPQVPVWMVDLVRYFELHRRGFSKYMNGVTTMLGGLQSIDSSFENRYDI